MLKMRVGQAENGAMMFTAIASTAGSGSFGRPVVLQHTSPGGRMEGIAMSRCHHFADVTEQDGKGGV